MNDEAVRELARQAGIGVEWTDASGTQQHVSIGSLRHVLGALGLPCATADDLRDSGVRLRQSGAAAPLITTTVDTPMPLPGAAPDTLAELLLEDGTRSSLTLWNDGGRAVLPPIGRPGYQRLRLIDREITLAVAPHRCVTLADVAAGGKLWGVGVQVYSLRRHGDYGIGDMTGVRGLGNHAAANGADAVALSPAHSLFPSDPGRYGPYSPSNRLFFNPLLVDPADALGAERVAAAMGEKIDPTTPLIDWESAARAKFALFRQLFDDFVERDLASTTPLAIEFETFRRDGGLLLDRHARFEAQMAGEGAPVDYYIFLQWLAAKAFATTQAELKTAGMRIGLITDLAIGLDRAGSQVGAAPDHFLNGVSIGAPPDPFNAKGQDWGLTSFSPRALVVSGFEAYIATLAANMRHAGGVRIDHAMGLKRLWLVPEGGSPKDGAYLGYPADDLMRLLALESQRHRAVVIGEDLGTVPHDFRQRCRDIGMAGMDVLWFQRDGGRFLGPHEWRDDAVAMTSTHDLPTVCGWWQGADLELRRGLGMMKQEDVAEREHDRGALWQAFDQAGVAGGPAPPPDQPIPAIDAAVAFVARSPSPLALIPLEDIIGVADQPNVPGTINEHPNWRRRFAKPAAELLQEPSAVERLRRLRETRR